MKRCGKSNLLTVFSTFILIVLTCWGTASAEILEYVGPNGTATPWETGSNWYSLDNGSHHAPTDADTARVYNALYGTFTNSNVTVSSTTAICQKLQMKYLITKLTVLTGGKLTTTGSVEMYQGTSSQIDIQAGATMDACTRTNTTAATFKLSHDDVTTIPATVNVWGTLNVISQNPANGTSDLQICNLAGGAGTGTLNIYSTGVVNVDSYAIGSYGTGRIYITIGGTMTIKGDATVQVNADIAAGKIAGASGATASCSYNGSDGKTYVTASSGGGPTPPEPPASISYPSSSSTGHYTVSWDASSGAISYQVERSSDGGSIWTQVYSAGSASYSENVTDGSYRYRVKATNTHGTSGWTTGNYDCVVSIPPPPTIQFVAGTPDGWDFGELDSDIALNNSVDWGDLGVIAQHWLASGCDGTNQWCGNADMDASSEVDFVDYALLTSEWSKQGAKTILLQTIYGTAQDAQGNITVNTNKALTPDKGCAMAFNVPQNTALGQGIFKCYGNPIVAGNTIRVRFYDVTGKNYLSFSGHPTVSKADPASGGEQLFRFNRGIIHWCFSFGARRRKTIF